MFVPRKVLTKPSSWCWAIDARIKFQTNCVSERVWCWACSLEGDCRADTQFHHYWLCYGWSMVASIDGFGSIKKFDKISGFLLLIPTWHFISRKSGLSSRAVHRLWNQQEMKRTEKRLWRHVEAEMVVTSRVADILWKVEFTLRIPLIFLLVKSLTSGGA